MKSYITSALNKFLNIAISWLPSHFLYKILYLIIPQIEEKQDVFFTYHQRPRSAQNVNTWSAQVEIPTFALIIQGPLIKDNNFTLESVRIYKKNCNNTAIILSTWDDEDKEYIQEFVNEDIIVLLNRKPANPGQQHINYQIVSSYEGVKKAKEVGATFAIKTRTDQRFYATSVPEYIYNVLSAYPVGASYRTCQKGRIIGISLNTFKYRLYGLSDMVVGGFIEDLLAYWGCSLDERPAGFNDTKLYPNMDLKTAANLKVCEVYLSANFCTNLGRELKWNLEDSWSVFADHFCILDKESLDLYWHKYARNSEHRYLSYDSIKTNQELGHREWLNLYKGIQNKRIFPEFTLSLKLGDKIIAK